MQRLDEESMLYLRQRQEVRARTGLHDGTSQQALSALESDPWRRPQAEACARRHSAIRIRSQELEVRCPPPRGLLCVVVSSHFVSSDS